MSASDDIIWGEIRFQRVECVVDTLVLAKTLAHYMDVAPIVGVNKRDPNFHEDLGRLMDLDNASGFDKFPYRSALVINKEHGIPGKAFFARARHHGHNIGYTYEQELEFWRNQIARLGIVLQ